MYVVTVSLLCFMFESPVFEVFALIFLLVHLSLSNCVLVSFPFSFIFISFTLMHTKNVLQMRLMCKPSVDIRIGVIYKLSQISPLRLYSLVRILMMPSLFPFVDMFSLCLGDILATPLT